MGGPETGGGSAFGKGAGGPCGGAPRAAQAPASGPVHRVAAPKRDGEDQEVGPEGILRNVTSPSNPGAATRVRGGSVSATTLPPRTTHRGIGRRRMASTPSSQSAKTRFAGRPAATAQSRPLERSGFVVTIS